MDHKYVTLDGNQAAAHIAYRTNEVIAIYPITPSSPMGEWADQWHVEGTRNLWGTVPVVQEMQSEGGAAGAVHGALQAGSLTTTFTASQGLLLMIPNMYKIAGELTPTVFHIAARSLAAQALSIFGDHSDIMAARSTGWAMLLSNSVQEVHDMALIAQSATLAARVPFLHVFDGFRTSHEVAKIELIPDDAIRSMIDDELVRGHRQRALSPEHPFIRGTAQNPDTFFQARETVNPYYEAVPELVESAMRRFEELTGRRYELFEYRGAPDAERVVVIMGSGAETVEETVDFMAERGERVGVLKVRLFRPFAAERLVAALPSSVKRIAVLDRTKEPGAAGEPLYQDVITALAEAAADTGRPFPRVIGGRYGLSSKEFTPAMAKAVLDELAVDEPRNHFTVGIRDDVSGTSLAFDPEFDIEPASVVRSVFWGLGSDGTVGANKNSVKIIGEGTSLYAQGYFVYDSRKAGARTVSHLRFGPDPIRSSYLISRADFVACHQFDFLERYDVLEAAHPGATFLLNSPYPASEVWDHIPAETQSSILEKKLDFWVIDAHAIAREVGLEGRINTVMQPCFFALTDVLPHAEALERIRDSIRHTYGKRGEPVVRQNLAAVDLALERLEQVTLPADAAATSSIHMAPAVPMDAPDFVRAVTAAMISGDGDELPVSAFPADGTYPSATTRWEKRNLALEVPEWDPDLCIQCGKCVLVCPHAVIRSKVVPDSALEGAPDGFKRAEARWRELADHEYVLQVSVEDCTGCELCVDICPAIDRANPEHRALDMVEQRPLRERGAEEWRYFLELPEVNRADGLRFNTVRNVQFLEPLFEFSSACSGCGETPYIKLLTQLFGDRAMVANATGCSSIYGGNMPTTPWAKNAQGRGPAWSNSLFEDNAEFGLGMRLTLDKQREYAGELLADLVAAQKSEAASEEAGKLSGLTTESSGLLPVPSGLTTEPSGLTPELVEGLLCADQSDDHGIQAQRERVETLKGILADRTDPRARDLLAVADVLVDKSVWLVGGDGWAYDIGYGGLDHVMASGRNVNILVLDTEVYSNTGGQASKATPLAAVARFAAGGKPTGKKDLGRMAMVYGNVYVAQVAMGASDTQLLRAFMEAESYPGPSLIIAYGHCIAHGIDMSKGLQQQRLAVEAGYWPLFRFDPRRTEQGLNPMQLDSKAPSIPLKDYAYNENRYRVLARTDPVAAELLLTEAQAAVDARWAIYSAMAQSH